MSIAYRFSVKWRAWFPVSESVAGWRNGQRLKLATGFQKEIRLVVPLVYIATVYMILRMRFLGLMVLGLILGLAIIAVVVYFYISLGYAPVGTAAPPFPFEKTITSMALNARIKKEAPAQPALPVTDDNLIAGARAYSKYCAVCHGLAGQPETEIAKGMFPKPPQLFNGHGVSDDPIGETYWKIENGIRLTGMPAFRQSLSENQIWQIALLLANAEKLPPAAKTVVSSPAP